jgi:transposase-like protein
MKSKEAARSVRRASGPGEKTGTHHRCADGDQAEGDEEATCVVAIAVGSSATVVVVDWSAARRSAAAFRLRLELFGANDSPRVFVIDNAARDMWWLGSLVPSTTPWASTRGRPRGFCRRVLVHP